MGDSLRSYIVTETKMSIIGAFLVLIGTLILLGGGYIIMFLPRYAMILLFGEEMGLIGGIVGCGVLLYTSYKLADVK